LKNKGRASPLDFKPDGDHFTHWIISEAFAYLSPLRVEHVGMAGSAKGFISMGEIEAYANMFPLMTQRGEFAILIRTLDILFLTNERQKQEQLNNAKKA
jgi:hypothetical protein